MVRHHPPICKVDVIFELDSNHLGVDLYDNAFQPITHTVSSALVIAIYVHVISDLEHLVPIG